MKTKNIKILFDYLRRLIKKKKRKKTEKKKKNKKSDLETKSWGRIVTDETKWKIAQKQWG